MSPDQPGLFDAEEPDGTRTYGVFRASTPKRAKRAVPLPPPLPPGELAALAADALTRWQTRIATARARIDHPEETTDGRTQRG